MRERPPRLVIAGAGPGAPGSWTLEALEALQGCERLFVSPSLPASAWAGLAPRPRRAAATGAPVLRALRAGRTAAYVAAGPPMSDPVAHALARTCARRRWPCTVLASLSQADRWLAETGKVLGHDLEGIAFGAAPGSVRPLAASAAYAQGPAAAAARGRAPSLRGRRVLVIGGTGFIGRHLVRRLHREGCRVHLLVREPSRAACFRALRPAPALHRGDLLDPASLRRAVRASRPELVFSLAALRDAEGTPARGRGDLRATLATARAIRARAPRLERWVRAGLRLSDAFPMSAEDRLIRRFVSRGLPVVTVRLFRVFGPGQGRDEWIPTVLRHIRSGRDLPVPREEGGQDWIHVADAVEAMIRAAHAPGAVGEAFEIGSGTTRTLRQAAEDLIAASGSRIRLRAAAGDPSRRGHAADWQPARRLLDWEPRRSLKTLVARR